MILIGSWNSPTVGNPILIAVATTGVIFAAVYLLWMVYRTFYGEVTDPKNEAMADLNGREIGLLLPLAALMLLLGFWPAPFLEQSERSVRSLLETSVAKAEAVEAAAPGEAVVVEVAWPAEIATQAPPPAAPDHDAPAH